MRQGGCEVEVEVGGTSVGVGVFTGVQPTKDDKNEIRIRR
jgi:hypothetical protein